MGFEFALRDGTVSFEINPRAYRLGAVKKVAYRFADRSTAVIGPVEPDRIHVTMQFKSSTTESEAREICRLFFQELLDQELREEIAEQTAPIRTLILAHAFSKADLINRE